MFFHISPFHDTTSFALRLSGSAFAPSLGKMTICIKSVLPIPEGATPSELQSLLEKFSDAAEEVSLSRASLLMPVVHHGLVGMGPRQQFLELQDAIFRIRTRLRFHGIT